MNFEEKYQQFVDLSLKEKKYSNVHQVIKILKVALNIGIGEGATDKKIVPSFIKQLSLIAGQKAVPTVAYESISDFQLREGTMIGCKVTITVKKRFFPLLEKIIRIVLPNTVGFKGISKGSFDGRGNLTFALNSQIYFPELKYDMIYKQKGIAVTVVTSSKCDEDAYLMFLALGFPFAPKTKGSWELK